MLESREKATPSMFGELLRNASMGDLRSCPVRLAKRRRQTFAVLSGCNASSSSSESVWAAAPHGPRPPQQPRDHHHRPGLGLGSLGPGRRRHPHAGNLPAPGRRKRPAETSTLDQFTRFYSIRENNIPSVHSSRLLFSLFNSVV